MDNIPAATSPGQDEIRAAVEARRAEEQGEMSLPKNGAAVSDEFVRECFAGNEIGDSLLYSAMMKGKFVKNADTKNEWLAFNKHFWEMDFSGRSLNACEDVANKYLQEIAATKQSIDDARKAPNPDADLIENLENKVSSWHKRVNRLRTHRGRESLLKCVASNSDPLICQYNDFDTDPMLLGVANGVIDLATGKLRDGRPQDFISKVSPIPYLGVKSSRDVWEGFLKQILDGNQELISYIQRYLGYSITGLTQENSFMVFYGPKGQNGKGTIMDMMITVLGTSLAGPIMTEMLLAQRNIRSPSGPTPDIMDLMGKRMIFAEETEDGHRWSGAAIKRYTGGGRLTGRNPNDRHPTKFTQTHSLFVLSNDEPAAPAQDNAFWVRMRKILFPYTFVDVPDPQKTWERQADRNLLKKLRAEAPGILAWLVEGCLLWQRDGMQTPDSVKNAVAEYRRNEDSFQDFLDECCEVEPDAQENATDLYEIFKKWWKARISPKPPSQVKFGKWMVLHFHRDNGEGNKKYYFGVKLKTPHFSSEN